MNVIRPSFYPHALAELAASLQRLAAKAAAGLQQLAGLDPQSSSVLTTGVGRYGKLMLVSRGQGFASCEIVSLRSQHTCFAVPETIRRGTDIVPPSNHLLVCRTCSAPPRASGRTWGRWWSSSASARRQRWAGACGLYCMPSVAVGWGMACAGQFHCTLKALQTRKRNSATSGCMPS